MLRRILSCVFIIALMLMAFVGKAYAQTMDTRTLATINKPGVVLVQTTWTADVTWYEFALHSSLESDLAYEVDRMIANGEIGSSDQEIYQAMVMLMINYMEYYAFSTGNTETEQMSTATVGTGFIVTPDGYIVTNAHVIHTDEEAMNMQFAMTSLEQHAIEATDSFMEDMRRLGYQMTDEEWNGFANAWYRLLAQSMDIRNLQTYYQCYIGNVSPGSDVSAKGRGLDLRKAGEPIPGKDIAILKMEGTNLPTVTLGDDAELQTGDRVYAMGYPAVATLSGALNVAQAIQEPTLTQGIVSARKEMAGGWNIIQTDAAIHGGNSGGPLFNEAGEVIAINTFGMIEESGASAAGMNFAIPISIAKQFLNEINVQPSQSDFSADFIEALEAYNNGEYNKALELVRGINETNPGFPVVQDLLANARRASDENPQSGADGQVSEASADARAGGGSDMLVMYIILAIIAAAAVVTAVILIKRKKSTPNGSTAQPSAQKEAPKQASVSAMEALAANCAKCGSELGKDSEFCKMCGGTSEETKEE
ncbi:MAG: trypsin-like peptidase domain-containing protein [Christensenellales bacterium]|jgi:serine protease Do